LIETNGIGSPQDEVWILYSSMFGYIRGRNESAAETAIVAPMTRVIRSVDRQRLGSVTAKTAHAVSALLVEMFIRDESLPGR
jgi:hypothetical protein